MGTKVLIGSEEFTAEPLDIINNIFIRVRRTSPRGVLRSEAEHTKQGISLSINTPLNPIMASSGNINIPYMYLVSTLDTKFFT